MMLRGATRLLVVIIHVHVGKIGVDVGIIDVHVVKASFCLCGNSEVSKPLERSVRVSSAQARGKRSCFAEYQPHIDLIIDNQN